MRSFILRNKFLIILLLAITSCSKDKDYDKSKAITAYVADNSLIVDESLKNASIILPKQKLNLNFLGSLSLLNQENENIAKNFSKNSNKIFNKKNKFSIKKTWSKSLFYGSAKNENFHFEPIIDKQKIYFLDSSGMLFAYDLLSKKLIWESQIFEKFLIQNYRTPQITMHQGKIFATIGSNFLVAVNATDGKVIWQKQVSAILTSKPVISDNFVYVVSDNNHLYCFDIENADLNFLHMGVARPTAILGSPMPVIYKDKILVSYSSGEVYALNKKTGEVLWVIDLNLNKAVSSDFYLNDVDSNLLVKNDQLYAISNSGLLKAIDVKNGSVIWKKQIASIANFWVASDYLFLINNDNKLLAINRLNGRIKWIKELEAYANPKKPATKFIYNSVILAGDKLVILRNDGVLIIASPQDGSIENNYSIGKKISHSPVIVNDKIYLQTVGRFTIEIIELN
jgi:outer membrane protein assembly factor BamB